MDDRNVCERCGDPAEAGRVKLDLRSGSVPPTWTTDTVTGRPAIVLCSTCFESLIDWLLTGGHQKATMSHVSPPGVWRSEAMLPQRGTSESRPHTRASAR